MSSIRGTLPDDDDKARVMIIQHLKSQGIFDAMRRECLADIDTKVKPLLLSLPLTSTTFYSLTTACLHQPYSEDRAVCQSILDSSRLERKTKQKPVT